MIEFGHESKYEQSKKILGIDIQDELLNEQIILKHFRSKVREYHPDSNKFCGKKQCLDTIKQAKQLLIQALKNKPIIINFDTIIESGEKKINELINEGEKIENISYVVVIDLIGDLTRYIIEENIEDVDFFDFFNDYDEYWANEISLAKRLEIIQKLGRKYIINTNGFIELIYTQYVKNSFKMVIMRENEGGFENKKFYKNIMNYYLDIGKEFKIKDCKPVLLKAISDDYLGVHYDFQTKLQDLLNQEITKNKSIK